MQYAKSRGMKYHYHLKLKEEQSQNAANMFMISTIVILVENNL